MNLFRKKEQPTLSPITDQPVPTASDNQQTPQTFIGYNGIHFTPNDNIMVIYVRHAQDVDMLQHGSTIRDTDGNSYMIIENNWIGYGTWRLTLLALEATA